MAVRVPTAPTSAPSSIRQDPLFLAYRAFSIYSGRWLWPTAAPPESAAQLPALVSQPQVCGGRRPASLGPAKPEPLHPVASADSFCAQKTRPRSARPREHRWSSLPIGSRPHLAHRASGRFTRAVHRLAFDGRFVSRRSGPEAACARAASGPLVGVVLGNGDLRLDGPQFHLLSSQPGGWTLRLPTSPRWWWGREDTLHFVRAEHTLR